MKWIVPKGLDSIMLVETSPVENPFVSNDFGSLNYEIKRTIHTAQIENL